LEPVSIHSNPFGRKGKKGKRGKKKKEKIEALKQCSRKRNPKICIQGQRCIANKARQKHHPSINRLSSHVVPIHCFVPMSIMRMSRFTAWEEEKQKGKKKLF